MFIKNFSNLAKTPNRKIILDLIESALSSIQPEEVTDKNFKLENNLLTIKDKTFNLGEFDRIFLLGFGKGSSKNSKIIEYKIGDKLTKGYVIDTNPDTFTKIKFTQGTHPLPSQVNIDFANNVLREIKDLTQKDLVIVIIAGGGSALFESPNIPLERLIEINNRLLKSGANISEINTVRKHLSAVKGGGLAKHLYPATVISLIYSDVPGNDFSVISSGPTVKDDTTSDDAKEILNKYFADFAGSDLVSELKDSLIETSKEDKYFKNVFNILVLSNLTALEAMEKKTQELGFIAKIFSDRFQGIARNVGKELIDKTSDNSVLLVGGETTVKVTGAGLGGRNQEVVLGALPFLDDKTVIASFDSDGFDNSHFAGAIGDFKTLKKARELDLTPQEFLDNNNSLEFFEKVDDGMETGRLASNVSDLIIILKS